MLTTHLPNERYLEAQARAFFSQPLSADEEGERTDWWAMSLETQQRDAK